MLSTVAGIKIDKDGVIFFRGMIPRLLINGIQFEGMLDDISAFDIDVIDIFKNPSVLFGSYGASGIIIITTKRGGNMAVIENVNKKTYAPMGYQKPVEFYAPKYDTLTSKNFCHPRLPHIHLLETRPPRFRRR